jgi:hypothetical protein
MVATRGHNDCSHKVIAALMALYDEEFDLKLREQQKQEQKSSNTALIVKVK